MRGREDSAKLIRFVSRHACGEVSERFKEHAWKACVGEILPWVRIPPSPPFLYHVRPLKWDRAFLNSNPTKSPELSISQPGDSYSSVQIHSVQVHQASRRLFCVIASLPFIRNRKIKPNRCVLGCRWVPVTPSDGQNLNLGRAQRHNQRNCIIGSC